MHQFLDSLEYIQIHINNSMFRNDILFVAVYVDDILICKSNKNKILDLVKRWHHTNSIAIMSYISNTLSNSRLASTLICCSLSFS